MSCCPRRSFADISIRTTRSRRARQPLQTRFAAASSLWSGRPNAGQVDLVNAVVGTKVAITSDTPQTTRHRLRAVIDRDDAQIVLVDTPGLHKPHDALGEELNRSALMALDDVDVVCFVLDASARVRQRGRVGAEHVASVPRPKVLVITKADLVGPEEAEPGRRTRRPS